MPEQYIGTQTWEEINLRGREWAKRELAKLITKAKKAGVQVVGLLVNGNPARQIVRAARVKKADIVIVGTHGRTGFSKLVLGSVAARVVATSPSPVLTVRSQ
jgi:nucleotide-binding universal stress UspA family protein